MKGKTGTVARLGTSIFAKKSSLTLGRHLWGAQKYAYEHHTSQVIIKSNYFDTFSFRGKRFISDKDTFSFFVLSTQDVAVRGMHKSEMNADLNKTLYGIVGRLPLTVYHENGTIDREGTGRLVEEHRIGKVRGISTSESLFQGFKFSSFLIPQRQGMIAIDQENVPSTERHNPNTNPILAEEQTLTDAVWVGNTVVERELTISAIHISAIIGGVSRDGMRINVEYNPLYVDQHLLSEELKNEYALMLNDFYKVIPFAREDRNAPEVKEFKEKQREFYEKYAKAAGLSESHIEAIKKTIEDKNALVGKEHDQSRSKEKTKQKTHTGAKGAGAIAAGVGIGVGLYAKSKSDQKKMTLNHDEMMFLVENGYALSVVRNREEAAKHQQEPVRKDAISLSDFYSHQGLIGISNDEEIKLQQKLHDGIRQHVVNAFKFNKEPVFLLIDGTHGAYDQKNYLLGKIGKRNIDPSQIRAVISKEEGKPWDEETAFKDIISKIKELKEEPQKENTQRTML